VLALLAGPAEAQIVRGQVVDSITQAPVSGAAVILLDADEAPAASAIADQEGLFLVRAREAGEYRLRVEHDDYRVSTFPAFALGRDEVKAFMLLVANLEPPEPSAEDVIVELCGDAMPGQGVLTGFVRDAVTRTPVPDASVVASWPAVSAVLPELVEVGDMGRVGGVVATDSAGVYVVCGVPSQTRVVIHAASSDRLSDFVEVRFDSNGVFVADSFHVTHQPIMRRDFQLTAAAHRTAAVRGVVMDASSLQPIMGATVEVVGTGLRTTIASDGSFDLRRLPAGPVSLSARRLGFSPVSHDVDLIHGETVSLPLGTFRLEELPVGLPPVIVEAERPTTRRPLTEFWERRKAGGGAFITREEFEKQGNPQKPTDVLRRMRGIKVRGNPNYGGSLPSGGGVDTRHYIIQTSRGPSRSFGAGECPPLLFLDHISLGDAAQVSIDDILPLVNIEAIEAYSSAATMPPQFNRTGSACGVIVFWTR
jgi:hypothetical protein